jgi:chaperonin cofactor prefoldin
MQASYAKWDNLDVSDSDEEDDEGDVDDSDDDDDYDEEDGLSVHMSRPPALGPPPAPLPPPPTAAGLSAEQRLQRIQRAELLGEEVLTHKQQLVDLDRRRNHNREALSALRRLESERISGGAGASSKHWVCLGDVFVKRTSGSAREMLEADQRTLEGEIERCRAKLKQKTTELCELDPTIADGSEVFHSFGTLQGVSLSDMTGLLGVPG